MTFIIWISLNHNEPGNITYHFSYLNTLIVYTSNKYYKHGFNCNFICKICVKSIYN